MSYPKDKIRTAAIAWCKARDSYYRTMNGKKWPQVVRLFKAMVRAIRVEINKENA